MSGYYPGDGDGEVLDTRTNFTVVKPCGGINFLPLLPANLSSVDDGQLPSVHCMCSWGDVTGVPCAGWKISSLIQILTPVVVSVLMGW